MKNDGNKADLLRHQEVLTAMETELAKLERKRERLFDSYEDGAYTREEFIERKQKHTAQIDSLKSKIQEVKQAAPEPVDYEERIVTLHSLIDCINDTTIDGKDKNVFLKQYISRITYDVIDYGINKGGKAVLDVFLK